MFVICPKKTITVALVSRGCLCWFLKDSSSLLSALAGEVVVEDFPIGEVGSVKVYYECNMSE